MRSVTTELQHWTAWLLYEYMEFTMRFWKILSGFLGCSRFCTEKTIFLIQWKNRNLNNNYIVRENRPLAALERKDLIVEEKQLDMIVSALCLIIIFSYFESHPRAFKGQKIRMHIPWFLWSGQVVHRSQGHEGSSLPPPSQPDLFPFFAKCAQHCWSAVATYFSSLSECLACSACLAWQPKKRAVLEYWWLLFTSSNP